MSYAFGMQIEPYIRARLNEEKKKEILQSVTSLAE